MKRLFTLLTALMLATALCAPVLADDAAVTDPTPNPMPTPTASIDTSNSDGVYVSAYTVTNAAEMCIRDRSMLDLYSGQRSRPSSSKKRGSPTLRGTGV